MNAGSFLADMKEIRRKAREHLNEGALLNHAVVQRIRRLA